MAQLTSETVLGPRPLRPRRPSRRWLSRVPPPTVAFWISRSSRACRVLDLDRLARDGHGPRSSTCSSELTTSATRALGRGCSFVLAEVERALGNLVTALELARDGQERGRTVAAAALQPRSTLPLEGSFRLSSDAATWRDTQLSRALEIARRTDSWIPDRVGRARAPRASRSGSPSDVVAHARAACRLHPQRGTSSSPEPCRFVDRPDRSAHRARAPRRSRRARRLVRGATLDGSAARSALAICARCRGHARRSGGELDDARRRVRRGARVAREGRAAARSCAHAARARRGAAASQAPQ